MHGPTRPNPTRPDPTRPDPTRPDPITLLRSLYLWNGLTDSRAVFFVRCHHSINFVFDRYRYPPVPATARGTCRGRATARGTSPAPQWCRHVAPLVVPRTSRDPAGARPVARARTASTSRAPAAEQIGLTSGADPAERLGWGQILAEGANLPPFSSFSTDLGHFILNLLNFYFYFLFYVKFLSLFSRWGGKQATLGLWGGHGPVPPPLDPPMAHFWAKLRRCQQAWR